MNAFLNCPKAAIFYVIFKFSDVIIILKGYLKNFEIKGNGIDDRIYFVTMAATYQIL